jgi:hypothetical protein
MEKPLPGSRRFEREIVSLWTLESSMFQILLTGFPIHLSWIDKWIISCWVSWEFDVLFIVVSWKQLMFDVQRVELSPFCNPNYIQVNLWLTTFVLKLVDRRNFVRWFAFEVNIFFSCLGFKCLWSLMIFLFFNFEFRKVSLWHKLDWLISVFKTWVNFLNPTRKYSFQSKFGPT